MSYICAILLGLDVISLLCFCQNLVCFAKEFVSIFIKYLLELFIFIDNIYIANYTMKLK